MIIKQISSLEKILPSENLTAPEINEFTVLLGERFSYQIAYRCDEKYERYGIRVESDLTVSVRDEKLVPVMTPYNRETADPGFITRMPFLCPDPLVENPGAVLAYEWYRGLWITAEGTDAPGKHEIKVIFEGEKTYEKVFTLEVINARLPEQELIYTNWFHTDCIASYYNLPMLGEAHWAMIGKFVETAVRNGMNMILTPIFTPPLDTEVGSERPTVQLVEISEADGKYSFDFSLLKRWIALCLKKGIKYFEMAHLFTQWGAEFTPKIIVNGSKKFGWHKSATGGEYKEFLSQFLPALTDFLKSEGVAGVTYFHISDEPNSAHLEKYLAAKEAAAKYLDGFKIMDALSNVDYFDKGVVALPVPASNHIKPFLERDIKERWTYYCVSQQDLVSNRFMAMPACRNRSISYQLFKHNIKGFLHWGFNFYYSQYSKRKINPFFETDAGGANPISKTDSGFPSGDSFSVYPGDDGAIESTRLIVFHEALQDLSAMRLLESKLGHKKSVEFIESTLSHKADFDICSKSADEILNLRLAVNRKIAELL